MGAPEAEGLAGTWPCEEVRRLASFQRHNPAQSQPQHPPVRAKRPAHESHPFACLETSNIWLGMLRGELRVEHNRGRAQRCATQHQRDERTNEVRTKRHREKQPDESKGADHDGPDDRDSSARLVQLIPSLFRLESRRNPHPIPIIVGPADAQAAPRAPGKRDPAQSRAMQSSSSSFPSLPDVKEEPREEAARLVRPWPPQARQRRQREA